MPHLGLLKCLHLAKIPNALTVAIKRFTMTWTIILTLETENRIIVSNGISIIRNITGWWPFCASFHFGAESIILPTAENKWLPARICQKYQCNSLFLCRDLKFYAKSVNNVKINWN